MKTFTGLNISMRFSLVALFAAANTFSQGTILWDESVNGPFSRNSDQPTVLGVLPSGTNSIIGRTESEPAPFGWEVFPDFFTFQVASNSVVSAISLTVSRPNTWTWIGNPNFTAELGFSFGPSSGELLSQLSLNSVGPGHYGMSMENHDVQAVPTVSSYRLDFVVGPNVPEPSMISLLLVGLGFLSSRNWKASARN